MDDLARAVLDRVAAAYAGLETLTTEIVLTTESGDEDSRNLSEQRGHGCYRAPDRVRVESGGRNGMVSVLNGEDLLTYFALPHRYARTSIAGQPYPRPGVFQPEFPGGNQGQIFLFDRIAEHVAHAEFDGEAIRVTYEESSRLVHVSFSPMLFWVDPETHLIVRTSCSMSHRRPDTGELHHQKQTTSFKELRVNEPVAPESFEFSPPPDAVLMQSGTISGVASRGGRGGGGRPSSSRWEDGAYIETSQLDFGGITVSIRRRLEVSEDRKELLINEEITGPGGPIQQEWRIPLTH